MLELCVMCALRCTRERISRIPLSCSISWVGGPPIRTRVLSPKPKTKCTKKQRKQIKMPKMLGLSGRATSCAKCICNLYVDLEPFLSRICRKQRKCYSPLIHLGRTTPVASRNPSRRACQILLLIIVCMWKEGKRFIFRLQLFKLMLSPRWPRTNDRVSFRGY